MPSFDKVQEGLASLWHPQNDWEIFPMSFGFFVFRYTTEDMDHVLFDGPWTLDDAVLISGSLIH